MPSVILRLLPTNPVTGADFTDYLNGLTIEVHELSLADPTGQGPAAGSASYLAPVLPASPSADPLAAARREHAHHPAFQHHTCRAGRFSAKHVRGRDGRRRNTGPSPGRRT